jgi:hypothetical protein
MKWDKEGEQTKTEIIARRFSQALLDDLDKEQLIELLFKNQQILKENKDYCASQDYCDANMIMSDTFDELGLKEDLWDGDEMSFYGINLWNRAWRLAQRKDFFITLGEPS